MNDKMMVESIFTECQKVKRVWKESGEDGNCYGAFLCAIWIDRKVGFNRSL